MKKITLAAVNARFSHSSLALLCLKHAAFEKEAVTLREYNLGQNTMDIAADIIATDPDAAGFSCYIWNIDTVVKIASVVKTVRPHCLVIFGGPEVSYDCEQLMRHWPFVDVIVRGAGETPFYHLTRSLAADESILSTPSSCIRTPSGVVHTPAAPPFELSSRPFLYDDLSAYKNKMIYYETSRGCPFRCAYCMSANEPLSFLPVERAIAELEYFMRADVRQVKLVDRTFNYPDKRARQIIAALIALKQKHPQSRTNYHFEISASLLTDETVALLASAPKGLLQLEIGIQSTDDAVLQAVSRTHDTRKLLKNTRTLCRAGNMRVFVDLIAGLPLETYESFSHSFDDAFALGADKLQLGFLKLLRGSKMRENASAHGIVYTSHAPYEVLQTPTLSYEELRRLHRIEQVLDSLYNEKLTQKTLSILTRVYRSPFAFFDGYTRFLEEEGYFSKPQKTETLFALLFCFARQAVDETLLREALAYDWLCLGKPGGWPDGIFVSTVNPKDALRRFSELPLSLSAREFGKRFTAAYFTTLFGAPVWLLFDHSKKRGDEGFITKIKQSETANASEMF